jgi:hypothetical protein
MIMKKRGNIQFNFTEINRDELLSVSGGSFAYDLGRFLRYMGVYLANGTGMVGTAAANADFIINQVLNGQ